MMRGSRRLSLALEVRRIAQGGYNYKPRVCEDLLYVIAPNILEIFKAVPMLQVCYMNGCISHDQQAAIQNYVKLSCLLSRE